MTIDVTCGVIIIDQNDKILICHPTNSPWSNWSLPKGIADHGEDHYLAACREVVEETGLIITPDSLVDLGTHKYRPEKDYHIFLTRYPDKIYPDLLNCFSMFIDFDGFELSEVDSYRMVTVEQAKKYLNKKQSELFGKVFSLV